jgi:ABC-type amino acid transport substrate-binding protein
VTEQGDGFLNKIVGEMFARAALDFELVKTPTRRGILDVAQGLIDAAVVPHADMRGFYPTLVPMPEPILPVNFAGIYLRDDITIRAVADFDTYRVGYIRGWALAEQLFAAHDGIELARDPRLLMEMLVRERVEVIFFSVPTAHVLAQELGLKDIKVSEFHIVKNLHLHFAKDSQDLIAILEPHVKAMKADGAYETLLLGYDAVLGHDPSASHAYGGSH